MAASGARRGCSAAALALACALLATAGAPAARALEYGGEGRGIPLAVYPSAGSIAAAEHFLAGRAGRTSLAVVDSMGRVSGVHLH